MDSLRRRVLAYDRERNSPRQMEVTSRDSETRLICLQCRRVPDIFAVHRAWVCADSRRLWHEWPGLNGLCPSCQGRLVEVTW